MNESARNRFRAVLNRIPANTQTVLDIGCARHNAAKRERASLHEHLVTETSAEVRGIDVLAEEIAVMQEEGYDVTVGDAETYNSEQEYDIHPSLAKRRTT